MSDANGASTVNAYRFRNKVAVVTGGSSGMGREAAIMLCREGATVVIADLREEALRNAFDQTQDTPTAAYIKSLGGTAVFVKTDISKLDEIQALVDATVQQFSKIDILLNFAGVNPTSAPLVDMPEKLFDLIYSINVRGCFFLNQAVLRQMVKQEVGTNGSRGKIVNIATYDGSKHAVIGITKSAACEHAKDRININAVAPGIVNTSMTLEYVKNPEVALHFQDKTRWPRPAQPADQAKMALFLASDDAEWITGSVHLVDGGLLAGY